MPVAATLSAVAAATFAKTSHLPHFQLLARLRPDPTTVWLRLASGNISCPRSARAGHLERRRRNLTHAFQNVQRRP